MALQPKLMTLDPSSTLRGLQACNYSAMGALTFTTWDMCITIGDEVRQIWSRPWTQLKSLYLFIRFFCFGTQLVSEVVALYLTSGITFSTRSCHIFVGFQGVSSQILQMTVQFLLILRILALYDKNTFLRRLLPCLLCAEAMTMSLVFGLDFSAIRYGPQCSVVHVPVSVIGFFVPPIIFETLLFALTMAKFYEALRDGWGREPVISRFLKDGIWVFALPFLSLTVNTCCMVLLDNPISTIAFPWVIAVPGFAGYRLILNMSHLLRVADLGESRLITDTVPEMLEEEVNDRAMRFAP